MAGFGKIVYRRHRPRHATGSQFLFLTDDSGVGNAHAEPHIPFYQVQKLDQLMIRMITCELSGKRVEPEPNSILRTVGKVIN